jgi:hypothetical protein
MTPAERARLIDQEEFRRESQRLRAEAFARLEAARAADHARFDHIRNPDRQYGNVERRTTYNGETKVVEKWITYNGETKSVEQWAKSLGLQLSSFENRIKKHGAIEAIAIGGRHSKVRKPAPKASQPIAGAKRYTANGFTMSLFEWSRRLNISVATIRNRMNRGASFEAAIDPNFEDGRRARLYTFDGKTLTVDQWAEELGLSPVTIYLRLKEHPIDVALRPKAPKAPKAPKPSSQVITVTIDGLTLTIPKWAKKAGIGFRAIYTRIHKGMTPEEAVRFYLDRNQRATWHSLSEPSRNSNMQRQEAAL